jgi:hypothetical protein
VEVKKPKDDEVLSSTLSTGFQNLYKHLEARGRMAKKESSLDNLKKDYLELQKKYGLPSFREMNEDFHIEKISESETELLIKEIRRFIGDRVMGYMRFVENLLNPINVPMFVFSIVKLLDSDDKKALQEVYKKMMEMEISFIELDLNFDEDKEAKFVKDYYNKWQEMKEDLFKIISKINKKRDEKSEAGNKGYFG